MEQLTFTFMAPSGIEYTIREQNGQDEEILTNVGEANRYMNLNNFLQAIIIKSSKKGGRFSIEEVLELPLLDRQCIFLQSRIFSLGAEMEFRQVWVDMDGNNTTIEYTIDLNEFLFDYANPDSIKDDTVLMAKPNALPFYPQDPYSPIYIELPSGRKARFTCFNGKSELQIMKMPENARTRNSDLIARNLELEVDGKWEKVYNFSLFSVKDMQRLRKSIEEYDPTPNLTTTIENPNTRETMEYSIMASVDFFFPRELA